MTDCVPEWRRKGPSRIKTVERGNCEMEFLSVRNKDNKDATKIVI